VINIAQLYCGILCSLPHAINKNQFDIYSELNVKYGIIKYPEKYLVECLHKHGINKDCFV
jgi:hypothetical protein